MSHELMSFSSMRDEVRLRLGNRTDIQSRIGDWLNMAMLSLAKTELEFPFLETQSTLLIMNEDQTSYDLEAIGLTDVLGIRLFRNTTDDQLLRRFPFREFRALATQASGTPTRWTRRGNTVFVDPAPDERKETLIDYRRLPQPDTVDFDSEWLNTIIDLATVYGWRGLQKYENAQRITQLLPAIVQLRLSQPLSQDDVEAQTDDVRVEMENRVF
jgi:hypothetical protein